MLILWITVLILWFSFVFYFMLWLERKIDTWIDKVEKRWFSAKEPYFWKNR